MFIFGKGKRALLDFLRNLSPQVVLIALCLVLWAQLDFRRFDLKNWAVTLSFYLCVFVLAAAMWANLSVFIDESLEVVGRYQRISRLMARRNASRWRVIGQVLHTMWRFDKGLFADFVISVIVINAGLLLVIIMGWVSAQSAVVTLVRMHG